MTGDRALIRPPEWWPERTRCAALLEIAIGRVFAADAARVAMLLRRDYPLTRESARIGLAIVFLSRGDEDKVRSWLERDWRDILVAAENTKVNAAAFFAWIASLDAAAGPAA